jgi:hypothetical protein
MIPENTFLGELTFLEIYEFYNMPVLFACRNSAGQIFLAVWIAEQENEDVWLYTPLSISRFFASRQGNIDLHEVFSEPEDGYIYQVFTVHNEGTQDWIQPVLAAAVEKKYLPQPHTFLDIRRSLPPIVWENVDQRRGSTLNKNQFLQFATPIAV